MLEKSDFISKNSRYYFFKSCGYLHEKDILKFIFNTKKPMILSHREKRENKLDKESLNKKGMIQTTLFNFIN